MRTLGSRDIMLVPADSLGLTGFRPFVVSPTNESDLALSPNGRLLAYSSDETGRFEIYLRPLPGPGRRVTVSLDGGIYSAWSHDGSTLFYQSGGVLMAARIAEQPELAVTRRDTLFAFPADDAANSINYAPGRDGGFVIASGPRISNPLRTAILVNWQSLFAKP